MEKATKIIQKFSMASLLMSANPQLSPSYGADIIPKTELTKKQINARRKSKAARKSRRINRGYNQNR